MARKLLNSSTVIDCRDLLASLRRFASRNSLTLTTVGTDWAEVFSQLYSELNRAFENKPKCLIFKHTDSLPILLNLIDMHICVPLNRLADDNALKRSWKVIVLKEEYSRKQLKYYECLTEDNFLRVSGFFNEETVRFFSDCPKARLFTPEDWQKVHRFFNGNPQELGDFKSRLASEKVGKYLLLVIQSTLKCMCSMS